MARKLKVDWQEDEQSLYKLYRQEKDPQNRTRLQALWLMCQGHCMRQVAEMIGVHYRTVQERIAWYRHGGVSEVLQHRHGGHGGPARRLTPAQEAELKAKAAHGEIRTIHDAVTWAKQVPGAHYSYWGMRWVFDRLALKKKVPRPKSPQASAPAQEAWKRGS